MNKENIDFVLMGNKLVADCKMDVTIRNIPTSNADICLAKMYGKIFVRQLKTSVEEMLLGN